MRSVVEENDVSVTGSQPLPLVQHKYRAYGLAIASDLELPELTPAAFETPDVEIRVVPTRSDFPAPNGPTQTSFGDEEFSLLSPRVGAFRVIAGQEIEIELAPDVDPGLVGFPLLGPVFAQLLQARGKLILHGSALEVNGAAVAFLGDKGAGKSTTAAAFLKAGHCLLTDDIVAVVDTEKGDPRIVPAFPQVKLSQQASSVVSLEQATLRRPVSMIVDKNRYRLKSGFSDQPQRPHAFYLLKRGEELSLEHLNHEDRLRAFLRFAYIMRFGSRAMTPSVATKHIRQCTALANQSTVAILTVPNDLQKLNRVVEFVERDVSSATAPA